MKNNSLKEIGEKLLSGKKVVIYPHSGVDGDALGSCTALCLALRNRGIESIVLTDEDMPNNLRFLDRGCCSSYMDDGNGADISVCVDSGEIQRIGDRGEVFNKAPFSICIDHHVTGKYFCDLNYIDSNAGATGEIMFSLFKECNIEITKEIAESLYTAIITDTGNFMYQNTRPITHEIAAELLEKGVRPDDVALQLYESNRMERLKIEGEAMRTLQLFSDGKIASVYVSQAMLELTGAKMDETDGIAPKVRSIKGVDVAIFFKEKAKDEIKVSMRSKKLLDVSKVSMAFGGGGHARAAGCTIRSDLDTAMKKVTEAVIEYMKEENL